MLIDFASFPKMARFSREVIVTEKLDGTNAQIFIGEAGEFLTGSRNRWITPEDDNYGFSRWAHNHKEELMKMGPGRHFGEWWGGGIQRGYGLAGSDKRFSLFNVQRWCEFGQTPSIIPTGDPRNVKLQDVLPACVGLVPVIWKGNFDELPLSEILSDLSSNGSRAVPGFMSPEGVVIFHVAGGIGFKKTLKDDGLPKSVADKGKKL